MSRFQFRLARLERVRQTQEHLAEERWAAAEARWREAAQRERLAQLAFERALDELRVAQGRGALSPPEVLRSQDALRRLAALAAREKAQTARRRAEADAAREPWRLLHAEVEGLERLHQRARASHLRDATTLEAREADERAIQGAARRSAALGGHPAPGENGRSRLHGAEAPLTERP